MSSVSKDVPSLPGPRSGLGLFDLRSRFDVSVGSRYLPERMSIRNVSRSVITCLLVVYLSVNMINEWILYLNVNVAVLWPLLYTR